MAMLAAALLFLVSLPSRAETLSSYLVPAADAPVVARLFGLEHRRADGFEVEVLAGEASLLLAVSPGARLLEADEPAALRARLQRYARRGESGYHSFEQVQDWLHTRASENRGLVSTVDYGLSRAGRNLTALHLASSASAGKPVVLITAATHGDELITTEVLLALADKLIAGYGKDDRLTRIVDSHDLYLVPVVNADGFANTSRFDGGRDPNRSYPWPGHEDSVPTSSIAGVMKLFSSLDVKASIDFHAYGEMIMYPWAYTHDPISPDPLRRLEELTARMADTNRYAHGSIADTIYLAPGSSADYYFWKNGTLSLGIEMGDDKIPDPREFPAYVKSQEESTWRFLEGI
jgi:hypothetical protein